MAAQTNFKERVGDVPREISRKLEKAMPVKKVVPIKRGSGFTLIELMIVVVIVGVLTLVAYPAYQSSVKKANRAEAKAYLMDAAQKEHLYFNDARSYADESELKLEVPERVATHYIISFDIHTAPPPQTFSIVATPKSSLQLGDGELSIDNAGDKVHELADGTEEGW